MHRACDVTWEQSGSDYGKMWLDRYTVSQLGCYVLGLLDHCIRVGLSKWFMSVLTSLYMIIQLVIGSFFYFNIMILERCVQAL